MSQSWFEIALYSHWCGQPHGIARVTKQLFLRSLVSPQLKYFYYCDQRKNFFAAESIKYFLTLANGKKNNNWKILRNNRQLYEHLNRNDRILITGAGWDQQEYLKNLKKIKRKKIQLACIIYDIIAVHSPQFFLQKFAKTVGTFQEQLVGLSNHVFCISKNTRQDVTRYLIKRKKTTTSVFRLGADF